MYRSGSSGLCSFSPGPGITHQFVKPSSGDERCPSRSDAGQRCGSESDDTAVATPVSFASRNPSRWGRKLSDRKGAGGRHHGWSQP